MTHRLADGVVGSNETMALEVMEKLRMGDMFLTKKNTMKHLREEEFVPGVIDRRSADLWEKDGSKSLEDRARAKVREAIAAPVPYPLDPKIVRRLDAMIDEASRAEITEPVR